MKLSVVTLLLALLLGMTVGAPAEALVREPPPPCPRPCPCPRSGPIIDCRSVQGVGSPTAKSGDYKPDCYSPRPCWRVD